MATPWAIEPSAALAGLIPPVHTTSIVPQEDPVAPSNDGESGKRKMTSAAAGIEVKESRACLTRIRTEGKQITRETEIIDDVRAGVFALFHVRGQQRKREEKKKRNLRKSKIHEQEL